MSAHRTIRARLTLTYVALLVGCTAAVLALSWWLLDRHLGRPSPPPTRT